MSNIELKPCPFCDEDAEMVEQKHREYASTYYVSCKSCHCKSVESMDIGIVVEAWNTRKPIDRIATELKKASTIYEMSEDNMTCAIEENIAVHIVENGGIL